MPLMRLHYLDEKVKCAGKFYLSAKVLSFHIEGFQSSLVNIDPLTTLPPFFIDISLKRPEGKQTKVKGSKQTSAKM